MKRTNNRIELYLLLVILPIITFTGYYSIQLYHKEDASRNKRAQWVASHQEEQWNHFIAQSVTTLNMLAITMTNMGNNDHKLESLLRQATETDPRYGGFFILDETGEVTYGEKSRLKETHLLKQQYIQEVIRTKDLIISDDPETLTNGHHAIGIAKPIVDENDHLTQIIIAYIDLDYIKSIVQLTFPSDRIIVTNSKDEKVLDINPFEDSERKERFYSLPINRIPWEVHVAIAKVDFIHLLTQITLFSIIITFIFHLIFFSIHSYLKQRQTAKELKQQQLQKLEVLGTFAASLAHEIRNPLTGIKGLVQLLLENHQAEKDHMYLTVISQEINRINEIVSEFLAFGKPSVIQTTAVDFNNILHDLLPFIEYEVSRNHHEFHAILPDKSVFIQGSKDHIKQVILNITKNAIEAMKQKGKVTLQLIPSQTQCQLVITDTGEGIPHKELKKIFNPFYTSKEAGTGLGLVVCKQIIESMNGQIDLSSEVHVGTTVIITLPLVHPSKKS